MIIISFAWRDGGLMSLNYMCGLPGRPSEPLSLPPRESGCLGSEKRPVIILIILRKEF